MILTELRPGLHRWTAPHPAWVPATEAGGPDDWPRLVGSVAWQGPDALVVIDPLVPAEHEDEFWAEMDALARDRVAVLTTIGFHRRSRAEFVARYGASTSRARRTLPIGVDTVRLRRFGETMVWLPEPGALVPGDRLVGDGRGGLRVCPDSWMRYLPGTPGARELRHALSTLLHLPVEMVLVSHGEPVLEGGEAAIARALGRDPEKARS
jgi:hypothetical protein